MAATANTELLLVHRTEWVCKCAVAGQGARVSVSLGQETLELVTSDVRQVVTGPGLREDSS